MQRPNIILTGFMATGKTAVGRHLARMLDYRFIDTDALIEARRGCAVADIFREHGEACFRGLEAEVARELALQAGLVIATGGRMMLDAANAAVLAITGKIFCLTAAAEEILARVEADGAALRPLLKTENRLERIRALLEERAAGYGRFPQIDTTGRSPEAVAGQIATMI